MRVLGRLTLSTHLVALALVTLVPVVLFSAFVLLSLWREQRETVERGLIDAARAKAFVVQRELETTVLALEGLARSGHLARGDLTAFYDEARRVQRGHPAWTTLILLDASGRQLLNLLRPLGPPLPGLTPEVIAAALAAGGPTVSGFESSLAADGASTWIGVPVRREGPPRYLLVTVLGQDKWAALLERWNVETSWTGFLVDQRGTIVARTRRSGAVGTPPPAEIPGADRTTREGMYQAHALDGVPVYTAWTRVPMSGWTVMVTTPRVLVETPLRRLTLQTGLVALAALVMAVLIAVLLSRRIARPIVGLTRAAEALAAGEAPGPLASTTVLEVADAAQALRQTGETLRQRAGEREAFLALEQTRRRVAEAVSAISRSLIQGLDVQVVAQQIAHHARGLLSAMAATLYRLEPETGALVMLALSGDIGPVLRPPFRLHPGEGLAGAALRQRRSIITPNLLAEAEVSFSPGFREAIEASAYRAALAVPLMVRERILGVFSVVDRMGREFTPADVRLAEAFAAHAAVALNNAQLYAAERAARAEAEAAAARSRLLADGSRALSSSLEYDRALAELVQVLTRDFADWAVVFLVRRDGTLRRVAAECSDASRRPLLAEFAAAAPPLPGEAARVLADGEPLVLLRPSGDDLRMLVADPRHAALLARLAPSALMVLPLAARGRVLGVLVLIRTASPVPFTDDDVRAARDLASRAALAVDGARLYRQAERARTEAEAASRAKDEFLAMLGHELRNPLAAIRNAVAVLGLIGEGDERAARARDVIARQIRHLTALVDDLLDVARVTTGKIVLQRQPLDLAEAVRRVVASLSAAQRTGRHQLRLDLAPAWVEADDTRIDQVITNLLVNAVKYTPAGGTITVTVRPEGSAATLVVRDTGVGMAPEVTPRVFDAFFQAQQAPDRAQGGLGLGLTLVRRLVELHGGNVAADSPGRGRGSTFTVRLPRVEPPGVTAQAALAAPARPLKVLLIEDNADARETLTVVLELAGHEVHQAPDGPLGVAQAAAVAPEVVLIDIGLPGLDGYEVARRLRARPQGRKALLVALTGYGREEDRRRAEEAGFDAHLVKPVDPAHLVALLADRVGTGVTSPGSGAPRPRA